MNSRYHPHNHGENLCEREEVVVESGRLWECENRVKVEKVVQMDEVVRCRFDPESREVPIMVMEEVF